MFGWERGALTIQEDGRDMNVEFGLIKGTLPPEYPVFGFFSVEIDFGVASESSFKIKILFLIC